MALDQITTGIIKDDAVTAAKIVAGAVIADVAADSVTASHLANDAVGTAQLANDVVISTSGAITTTGGLTVGVDGTGQDVKLFGATAGAYLEWDESADELEIRGPVATPGKLLLSTAETTVVDGNKLGQIDFQAPLDSAGTDAILVGASIYAEADNTFSSTVNETELVFAVGNSEAAVEQMRLTKKGALRLDHSSPQNTSNMDIHAIEVVRTPNNDHAELNISFLQNAPSGYTSSGDHLGGILFGGASQAGTVYHGVAAIKANASASWAAGGSGDAPAELTFHTTPDGSVTPAERMVIDKDGNVGIGTASPSGTFDVHQTSGGYPAINTDQSTAGEVVFNAYHSGSGDAYGVFVHFQNSTNSGNGTHNLMYRGRYGGTNSFQVWDDGDVQNVNGTYGDALSDERLKYNITDVNSQWDDVKNINIVNYKKTTLKGGPNDFSRIGVIAQQAESISPNLIKLRVPDVEEIKANPIFGTLDENGKVDEVKEMVKTFKDSIFFWKCAKALQEAMVKIETLEAKVLVLESA